MPEPQEQLRIPAEGPAASLDELDGPSLACAQQGEEAGLRAVFQTYHRRVFAYLWRMLATRGSKETVEDLVQDVFLRVFASLPKFSPSGPAKLSTWILTIAHRLALNELRKSKYREARLEQVACQPEPLPPADQTERRLILGQNLKNALAKLPDEQRSVFLLAEYHGLTPEEASQAADIPVGTAKSRLHRARAALRKALESDDE